MQSEAEAFAPEVKSTYSGPVPCQGRRRVRNESCRITQHGKTLKFDADGQDGSNGAAGHRGANGGTAGANGGDGGHGSDGTGGTDAGSVVVVLRSDKDSLTVSQRRFSYGELEHITVSSRGGAGGSGGSGGDGGDGAVGRRGQDATRVSNGTDGGPGGDGGNGGNGGNGGVGGNGGSIVVDAREEDTFLLMLVEGLERPINDISQFAAGGRAGIGGACGNAGKGGSGGQGGNSHSWKTTEGTGDARREIVRSNPGGSRGQSGHRGSVGRTGTTSQDGERGSYGVHVDGVEYAQRFDLSLADFAILEDPAHDSFHDGLFEPGEVIVCNGFLVQNPNAASMSTPTFHQRAEISLSGNTKWTTPLPAGPRAFVGPRVRIEAEQEYSVPGDQLLRFRLRYPDLAQYGQDFDAIEISDSITPVADQLGWPQNEDHFRCRYQNFSISKDLSARFPVMAPSGIDALTTIAPGERCVIRLPVKNLGRRALGSAEAGERRVLVRWSASEVEAGIQGIQHVDVRDEHRQTVDTLPLVVDVPSLPAVASDVVQIQFGWKRSAEEFAEVTLHAALCIEALDVDGWSTAPEEMRWVHGPEEVHVTDAQRRMLKFVCVPSFAAPLCLNEQHAAAIVIYSPGVPTEISMFWTDLLRDPTKGFGFPTAIWNMQRYGHFDPGRSEGLAQMVADAPGLLVVVLDFAFKVQGSAAKADVQMAFPSEMLDQNVLHSCFPAATTRFLFVSSHADRLRSATGVLNCPVRLMVGPAAQEDSAVSLDPEPGPDPASTYSESGLQTVLGGSVSGTKTIFGFTRLPCCMQPGMNYTGRQGEVQAAALAHAVAAIQPLCRIVTVCEPFPQPEPSKSGAGCCRTPWELGTLKLLAEPASEADAAAWDRTTEVFGLTGLETLAGYRARLRSVSWVVAAALPRHSRVDILWAEFQDLHRRAETESRTVSASSVYRVRLGHGRAEIQVGALLFELERELLDALADPSRPPEKAMPTLDLLRTKASTIRLPDLPTPCAAAPQCTQVAAHSCAPGTLKLRAPCADKNTSSVVPVDVEAGQAGESTTVAAADSPAGLLLVLGKGGDAAMSPDAEVGPSGAVDGGKDWYLALSLDQQVCLMAFAWWKLVLHVLASILTLGLWFAYIWTLDHTKKGKQIKLLAIPPCAGLVGRAHAVALDTARELLCGLRVLANTAHAAGQSAKDPTARERATSLEERLRIAGEELRAGGLLPDGCWVPSAAEPCSTEALAEFLGRRDAGLELQRKGLAQKDACRFFGLQGWANWRLPEGSEEQVRGGQFASLIHHTPEIGRLSHYSAEQWRSMQGQERERATRHAKLGVAAVEKHDDMIVTDDTEFVVCSLCGRHVPAKHESRHRETECRKRNQGLDYLLRIVKEPTSHKHLTDEMLSAVEGACEEGGAAALQSEERDHLASLLKYIRLERELARLLTTPAEKVDPFQLERARDDVRSAAACRTMEDDAQGLYVASAGERLAEAVPLSLAGEVKRLSEACVTEAAALILAELRPPTEDVKRGKGNPPWLDLFKPANPRASRGNTNGSRSQGNNPIEIDLMTKGDRLFALVEVARTNGIEVQESALEACRQLALAELWLCPAEDDPLKQCLQFCRKFDLQQSTFYETRAAELKAMRKMPETWNLDEILASAGGDSVAKIELNDSRVTPVFQALFDLTFKRKYTRDRKGERVPSGLQVVSVKKVMNVHVWQEYVLCREKVARSSRKRSLPWPNDVPKPITGAWAESDEVKTVHGLVDPLRTDVNEFWLLHGTSPTAAEGITSDDFRLNLAGSNAGTLYGRGIYLAEACSKSDEYAKAGEDGLHTLLVCRATLGNVLYTDERTPDVTGLEKQCGFLSKKDGKYHCVLGDREKCSGTYREFIIFNDDLVYPAFIVFYKRV